MIPVKIKLPLYIRNGAGTSFSKIGIAQASGKVIMMNGVEMGQTWKGRDQWYFKVNDKQEKQWYWSGRVEEVSVKEDLIKFDPAKMSWAHDSVANGGLGIIELWNSMGVRGEGVSVAILDTGIIAHDDFTRDGSSIIKGNFFINGLSDIIDRVGHGTQCAGILAGTGNKFVHGIAPAIDLYVVKISAFGAISDNGDEILEGLKLLQNSQQKMDIISISYNYSKKNLELENLIDTLSKESFVIAALNHSINNSTTVNDEQFPADIPNVIPIAAYARFQAPRIIPAQVLRTKINWLFPGKDIQTISKDGLKSFGQNTSIATPIASGVFALFLSYMKKKGLPINSANRILLSELLSMNVLQDITVDAGDTKLSISVCNCNPHQSFILFDNILKT